MANVWSHFCKVAAYDRWKLVLRNPLLLDPISWDFFFQEFHTKYVTDDYRKTKWKQFLNLKQGKMTVAEYEKEFSRLSKYPPEPILIFDVDSLRMAKMSL